MNNGEVKAYYQNIERYDWIEDTRYPAKLFHQMRARHIAKLANQFIHLDSDVLDIGCGTGLITRELQGRVIGLDINAWAVRKAISHCPQAKFQVADSETLLFPDASIDVIVCSDMLEHLYDPTASLAEMYRVLVTGGYLIGEVPTESLLWRYRRLCGSTYKCREPIHRNYTIPRVRAMLSRFTCLEVHRTVLGCEISFVACKDSA